HRPPGGRPGLLRRGVRHQRFHHSGVGPPRTHISGKGAFLLTRRDLFHKWLIYALGLLPVWLLDAYLLPRYPLFGVTPMLLPLAVAAVAVSEGAYAGTGFGLAVGLLWEVAYPA